MNNVAAVFDVPVFRSDLRVMANEEGDVEFRGASDDAVAFLMVIQSDDLEGVRRMYAEDPDQMKMLRGRVSLGQEIADRVAQVTRRAIESGIVIYSNRDKQWVLDALRVRNSLFGMPGGL